MPKRLTADEVRQVKKLLKQQKVTVTPRYTAVEIARRFGVAPTTIRGIRSGYRRGNG